MKVLVAGATGAVGRVLVPRLLNAGYEVSGWAKSPAKVAELRATGAEAVAVDALDRKAVSEAARRSEPDVIINQLTAIPQRINMRKFDRDFASTNRLRTEAVDNLIAAAQAVGVRRIITQGFIGWGYERTGSTVKTEDDPLDSNPPAEVRESFRALRYLERKHAEATSLEALVLRYGFFYGAGTSIASDGAIVEDVRKRRIPVVGGGHGIWSFVHIEDAAEATLVAVERGAPGIYNVVDDEPAPVSEWLAALADAARAKRPFPVPAFIARPLLGKAGVLMMTENRGASNAKAKRELRWQLRYPSWRQGFKALLANPN